MSRTKTAFLAEADELIHKPQFSREDASRVESILAMADRLPNDEQHEPGRLPIDKSFRAYLTRGRSAVTEGLVDSKRIIGNTSEIRAAQSTTTSSGGYLAPASFSDRLEEILKASDPLYALATELRTTRGTACGVPVVDDVEVSGAIVAQNAASSQTADAVFGNLALDPAPTYRSGLLRCPIELVNDSAFSLENLLARAFGVRLIRQISADFTTNMLSNAVVGKTAASASAIAGDELWDLIGSLDDSYASNAGFVLRKSVFVALSKLRATSGGEYLFPTSRDAQGRPVLAGFPCYFSGSMPALGAGNKVIAFGDFSRFVRRVVADSLVTKVYVERFAEYSQIGYEGYFRVNGGLPKGTTVSPIVLLQMAAS